MGKVAGAIVGFLTVLGISFIVSPDVYSVQLENFIFTMDILSFLTFTAQEILFSLKPDLLTTVIASWAAGGFVAGLISRRIKSGLAAIIAIELMYLILYIYPSFAFEVLIETSMVISIVLALFVSGLTSLVGSSLMSEKEEVGEISIPEQPTIKTTPSEPTIIPAIKKCPHCGATISSTATVCPYCGKPVD
ncbi:MAG: zinc ribbon domain-containing protein [Candidatus Asgardarchaeia archaeon]